MATVVLWALVGGTVVGLLGKLLAPGDPVAIPLWLTILCGIGGMLLGTWFHGRLFDATVGAVDWWRHGWQVATAAVLVLLVARTSRRERL